VFEVVDLAQTHAAVLILRLNFNPAHRAMVDDECVGFHERASLGYAI
jgi:hypothetical protein